MPKLIRILKLPMEHEKKMKEASEMEVGNSKVRRKTNSLHIAKLWLYFLC